MNISSIGCEKYATSLNCIFFSLWMDSVSLIHRRLLALSLSLSCLSQPVAQCLLHFTDRKLRFRENTILFVLLIIIAHVKRYYPRASWRKKTEMIYHVLCIVTAIKLILIPVYHSTDFEVHRNWLALTHNLTYEKWYYESTSEWTLDYPPFFAWLECGLSYIGRLFDPKMLELNNLNYASDMTVLFQRLSVIILDVIYIQGVRSCTKLLSRGELLAFVLLAANPGLLMVDHIHFQYNGFMYGILMYSISHIIRTNHLQGAFWFAVLLNLKHIFLYIAPVYIIYLFRAYCFTVSSVDGEHTPWYSFEILNLIKLGTVVLSVLLVSFGPFIDHIPQLLSRLFPFKRGLCHAYWAPNFWALYNFGDKVLQHTLPKFGIPVNKTEAAMTGGLVQEFDHSVLPSITPGITLGVTLIAMAPALVKMWNLCADRRYRPMSFIRCIIVCATCSFLFSWHVHEKAVLMILIPLSFMSVLGVEDAKLFLILSTVGHYSLFPLLYPKSLLGIKLFMLLTHVSIAFSFIPQLYDIRNRVVRKVSLLQLPMLNYFESTYLYGLLLLCVYENIVHVVWGLNKTLPFLPLMMTSVYCSIGVLYFWVKYYYYFLTFNLSWVPTFVTPSLLNYLKKNS